MSITSLDGNQFAEMIIIGANHLSANAKMVDALNVFPVPDGDTGTNMNLSMSSGSKEVQNNRQEHIGKVAAALSKGLLMGARGNSGVILSQLFRGFAKDIEAKPFLSAEEFAHALEAGVNTAYKAVMKPVEGTILTVAKDSAKKAVEIAKNESNIVIIMENTLQEAKASLQRTPDLLPVLKEVGVVDSGGQGLVCVYEGFLAVLKGEKLPDTPLLAPSMDELVSAQHHQSVQSFMNTEDIEYGYCTEFMVKFEKDKKAFSEIDFQKDLSEFGDSLLVISDEDVVKVHIHAEHPGEVLSYGQQYGSLINMKIENMREQHSSIVDQDHHVDAKTNSKEKQEYAIIAVSMGSGIASLFKSIGATEVIEGGQTMNPSTEDIMKAIKAANANKVIILPNNKNIIMAAEQAAEIAEEEVIVVPTKTVPQGLAAVLAFNPTQTLEKNGQGMKEAISAIKTGQVTFAVRDTMIDGLQIAKDDYMGINDGKIVGTNKDLVKAAYHLLTNMIDEDSEILTIIYGEDTKQDELNQLLDLINEQYEDIEIEVHNGKQPLYNFIFSVE
ncbi:DAK2 domain-containing protein [Lederbergia panacisoli]|uniref:DAK2 domain-containing protein n=1 Tax=Lederbergia panacisoli TaxID=1255251 RepID=UPI00214CF01B|nr:DAK2 domain-containing protein [Lederbergia panacisoli]MCR2820762.1 DAK2 domain-containing protein [Lederbergia panacisoli]